LEAKIDINNKDQLPLSLEPKHIRTILDIGERQVYEFLNNNPPFVVHRVGRTLKIPREKFFDWFEGKRG